MSQQHASSSLSSHEAQGSKPSKQETPAATFPIVALSPDAVRPVKPARIIHSHQDQADRASLTQSSSVEAGRSDPDRQVDETSDQMLSAVSADQHRSGFQSLPVNVPVWTPLPQMVPSQSVASPGVLQGVDCQTPSECGLR